MEQSSKEKIGQRYKQFVTDNMDLCRAAYEEAKRSLQESDARLPDGHITDAIQVTRDELFLICEALDRSAGDLDRACTEHLCGMLETFGGKLSQSLVAESMKLKVRSMQQLELGMKLEKEARKRWEAERRE